MFLLFRSQTILWLNPIEWFSRNEKEKTSGLRFELCSVARDATDIAIVMPHHNLFIHCQEHD